MPKRWPKRSASRAADAATSPTATWTPPPPPHPPADFIALVQKHGIAFHEKHKGQLFAARSAEDIIAMLLAECAAGQVTHWQPSFVKNIKFLAPGAYPSSATSYQIDTDRGPVQARSLVIATGGLSIPKIGATDFGYRLAQQFK